jgi:iron complex outermembrane receptor protein
MIIMFKKTHIFALSILSLSIQHAFAQNSQQEVDVNDLPTIELQAQSTPKDHLNHAAGDTVIGKDQLVQGATNWQCLKWSGRYLLSSIHGGVSRPVIRGQDGARVKITQNGGDPLDVSSVSPDHAVTVDPNSADQIEVLRGPKH